MSLWPHCHLQHLLTSRHELEAGGHVGLAGKALVEVVCPVSCGGGNWTVGFDTCLILTWSIRTLRSVLTVSSGVFCFRKYRFA